MAKQNKGNLIATFERNDGGIDWQWRDGAWRPRVPDVAWFKSHPSEDRHYWFYPAGMPSENDEWIEVVW